MESDSKRDDSECDACANFMAQQPGGCCMMDNSCTEAQMQTPASVIASTPCHSLANIESCGREIASACQGASDNFAADGQHAGAGSGSNSKLSAGDDVAIVIGALAFIVIAVVVGLYVKQPSSKV
jgi:hypothetical protein